MLIILIEVYLYVKGDGSNEIRLTSRSVVKCYKQYDQFLILISSPGGNVLAGISGFNFLKGIPAEVIMHNYGCVASITAVLYCAGSTRYCVPHATFTLHGVTLDVK